MESISTYPPIRAGRPPRHEGSSRDGSSRTSKDGSGRSPREQSYPGPQYQQSPGGVTASITLATAGAQLYESPKAGSTAVQRHGFQASGASPLSPPYSPSISTGGGKLHISYANRKPLRQDASWFAMMAALAYFAAVIYYLYVRIAFTLDMKDRWYSICVLVVEWIGITSVVPYALLNMIHSHPTGSAGLPVDDGHMESDKRFTVRVMIPCYKESLGTLTATITAAMQADLPPGVTRELYLCDDGKDREKRAWLEKEFGDGQRGKVHYVTGRSRATEEINGKSGNLNNVLKNIIYQEYKTPADIPLEEVIVVFDADMAAKRNFFCKILEVMCDDSIALCLSPQAFSNVNPATDIYNNTNKQFWEYVLPGLDAMGYIACTGTNFCIRARALATVGWFPEYCITEDYALSMELKAAGFKGSYLAEYLAEGEAPEELRNVLRQRSRWTKGHMQVFFSSRNPLLRWKLPLGHKLLYNNGTWSYFCTIITTWTFLLVPFISLMFEIQPVKFGRHFSIAASLYLFANFVVQNYFHVAGHMQGIWMANVSNYLLSFTYAKAILNTLLAKVHIKKKAGFKPTEKKQGAGGSTVLLQSALLSRLTSLTKRFNQAALPQLYQPQQTPTGNQKNEDECIPDKIFMFLCLSICLNTLVLGLHQVIVLGKFTAWLALPMLWAINNAVPPILFFGYLFASSDNLHNMCFWLQLLGMSSGLGAVVCLWFVSPVVYAGGTLA